MSNNDDFLRDFFKDQHLNSDDENFQNAKNNTENKKEENNKNNEKTPIITRYSSSENFSSAKEINLRKLFEGIEKEKKEYRQRRKKIVKKAVEEKVFYRNDIQNSSINEETSENKKNISENNTKNIYQEIEYSRQFIEDIARIEYRKKKREKEIEIQKNLQNLQKRYEHSCLYVLETLQENIKTETAEDKRTSANKKFEEIQYLEKNKIEDKKSEIKKEINEQKREQKREKRREISLFGNIKTLETLTAQQKKIKLNTLSSFIAVPKKGQRNKKEEKKEITSSICSQPFSVQSVQLHSSSETKQKKQNNASIPKISEYKTNFSSSLFHEEKEYIQENKKQEKQEKQEKQKIIENISFKDVKRENFREKREKKYEENTTETTPLFRVSRTGKKYISDIWESHPERIPNFEIHSLSSADEKIENISSRETNGNEKNGKTEKSLFSFFHSFLDTAPKKIEKLSKKGFKKGIHLTKTHAKKLQREWDLYTEMISSAHQKSKKISQKILRKGDEHIASLHAHGKKIVNDWREKQEQAKKLQAKKQEQLAKQQEQERKLERERQEKIIQEKLEEKLEREKQIIAEKEQKEIFKKLQAEKKQEQAKQQAEKKIAIPQFSQKKGKINLSFLPSKAEVKEWAQIAGMVASVFIVGVVGLRLPGLMSQYESVLNADFFDEQQESVSFLLNKKENPFKNIKSLPVAGNISVKSEEINTNEFLNINPPDTRIVIPKIAKNIPILEIGDDSRLSEDWEKLELDIQDALQDGVVHYPGTALPGEEGNVFITGHSSYYPWDSGRYKDVFAALHNLEVGDEYFIFHKGKKYKYIITTRKIVPPSDVSVLDQDRSKKESTLMTCTPVGTAKNRLILQAREVSIEY